MNKVIRFFLENKLVTVLLLLLFVGWGVATAPFNWEMEWYPRDPVPVDAIPDIGPNQQIVFTKWPGRSPQDIQDQITYPLTTALLGVPGVRSVRSSSMFGFSSIYIIFEEGVDFYWARSRILEKLSSLPSGTLPEGVQPSLGPDATALGQVYWYTLEGRNPKTGKPTGGWDPQELRSIQDWQVRWSLLSASGVAEVASIGGYVKEYQVDVDPMAMKSYDISLKEIIHAVKNSNLDIGASTVEINNAEYIVRGLGYVENLKDIEQAVVAVHDETPIRIKDIARVNYGPAERRGALDKEGSEAVGGVVVARYGKNPMKVIKNVKEKIKEIEPGLPSKKLADGTTSKVEIIPFYDRTELIMETLGTLEEALKHEILITVIVILIMLLHVRASFLVAGVLPVAVLMCFIAMKYGGVDANIVALSGIAIAIGTMVDMAVILTENITRHLKKAPSDSDKQEVVFQASTEVASAIMTSIAIIIVSFLPVFTMQQAEGKMFRPLAFTKTFALLASIIITIFIIPTFAQWFLPSPGQKKSWWHRFKRWTFVLNGIWLLAGLVMALLFKVWLGLILILLGVVNIAHHYVPKRYQRYTNYGPLALLAGAALYLLAKAWLPLGPQNTLWTNFIFVAVIVLVLLALFALIIRYYKPILRIFLEYRKSFLSGVGILIIWGFLGWWGWNGMFGWVAQGTQKIGIELQETNGWQWLTDRFPGAGEEFMPDLDEGDFLLMPTTPYHVGFEESKDLLQRMDRAVAAIPEVKQVVGKLGRVSSPLDPAPVGMYENIIDYKSEYKQDEDGHRIRFKVDDQGEFVRDSSGELVPDPDGRFYRQWRDHIQSTDDIWDEIVQATDFPAITSAPKLQPIETRLVMLQTGMRAPMGVKVYGPQLDTIQAFGLKLEQILKEVEGIMPASVYADRVVGKPYLNIELDRQALARYGLTVKEAQRYIETGIGGMPLTETVEGRERYPVRVRFPREWRNNPEAMGRLPIPTPNGPQIPLRELADIKYQKGPQVIKTENTYLTSYITFEGKEGYAEIPVVNNAKEHIRKKIEQGELRVPNGVSYEFAGNYENQVRAQKRLNIVIPIALAIIFLILYLEFRSVPTSLMISTSLLVAFSGGFILIWLYGQEWFMNFSIAGQNLREVFQMRTINLSTAVWVGFIALFGIAVEGAVVIAVYLQQLFRKRNPSTRQAIRNTVMEAGKIRVRPTLMTTATTILALLPVLSSTGKGAGVLVPMAIPTFGGMTIQIITFFVIPVLYCMWAEWNLKRLPKNQSS